MRVLGDFAVGATIDFFFSTHKADGTPITLAGTPKVTVYKANSTTQFGTDIDPDVDFDGVTGFHHVRVVMTDGFFAAGAEYCAMLSAGTVDGVSVVGTVLAHWTIAHTSALRPATAGRTIAVDASGNAPATIAIGAIANTAIRAASFDTAAIDANVLAADCISANKVAAGAIHATALAQNSITALALASDAVAEIVDDVWDEQRAGHVAAGSFGQGAASVQGNVTGSVGSVTGAVGSVTGAVGSVTGNVGGNVTGSVGSVAAGGITAASIATDAIDDDAIANGAINNTAFTALAIDAIWDEVVTGATTARQAVTAILDDTGTSGVVLADGTITTNAGTAATQATNAAASASAIQTILTGITSLGNWLRALVRKDAANATAKTEINSGGGAYDEATDSQEAIRDRGDTAWTTGSAAPSAADVANAVWDEAVGDHAGAGSTGATLAAASAPSAATVADAVWDEALAGHAGAGSAGAALSAAGVAGDPWTAALGGYPAGQAGYVLNNTPAAVNTALAAAHGSGAWGGQVPILTTANLPGIQYVTGRTVYARIRDPLTGFWWGGAAFAAWADGSVGSYDVAMTEVGTSGYYDLDAWPAGISNAQEYEIIYYDQAGASPALADDCLGGERWYWPGASGILGSDLYTVLSDIESALGVPTVTVTSNIGVGGDITSYVGTSLSASITLGASLAGRTKLYCTVKRNLADADSAAVLQFEETAGLLVLNEAAATYAADADIVVTDVPSGAITLTVAARAMESVPVGRYTYDVKTVDATGAHLMTLVSWTHEYPATRARA